METYTACCAGVIFQIKGMFPFSNVFHQEMKWHERRGGDSSGEETIILSLGFSVLATEKIICHGHLCCMQHEEVEKRRKLTAKSVYLSESFTPNRDQNLGLLGFCLHD